MKLWQIRYYNTYGENVYVVICAKTKKSALNKFHRELGFYTVIDMKVIC